MQAAETSPSTTAIRDEFLQIRMLSPEPGGEDLAPPERLPDDILDGNNLQQLFSELPDGRYQIEYVLGDGYERVILTVDLRDGEAIIPGDQTEGGTLRLTPIENGEWPPSEDASRLPEDDEQDESEILEEDKIRNAPADEQVPQRQDAAQPTISDVSSFSGAGMLLAVGPLTRRSNRLRRPRRYGSFSVAARMANRRQRQAENG